MAGLTRQQQKWHNHLSAEIQRQKDTYMQHSSYPCFMLECCGCFMDLKTSDPKKAQDFIMEHRGHKAFSMETNKRPNALKYDRKLVLEQVIELGHHIVDTYPEEGIVVKNTRTTYLAIKNGIDIQGALERLQSVYTTKNNFRREVTQQTPQLWVAAIIYQDHKMIKYLKGLTNREN